MLKISKVKKGGIAKELGLEVGDEILSFDNLPCEDELDLVYFNEQKSFSLTVKDHRTGQENILQVEKEEGEELGLQVEKSDTIRTCHNRCVFCFVDQMPKGMRESLYIKDDDYSMSFACGNFVTLTNLSDECLQRIIRLQLSPLYISVHTMNGKLREELLRNRFAGKIAQQIKILAENGIEMHTQAVIVPNKNDGEELKYTARELFKYYPTVKDLACVPTGLTKYRENLTKIPDIDKEYSEKLLDLVDELNKEFGVDFLLPADEYFVKAEREFKGVEFYGEFEQIENGVGMTSKFHFEAYNALDELPQGFALKKPKKSLLISGVSGAKANAKLIKECNDKIGGLQAEILAVRNEFFGETVTCTGLLTGKDIAKAVEEYTASGGVFDEILLPSSVLKEFDEVFLCGMSLKQLKKRLHCKNIRVNYDGGYGLINMLVGKRSKK